MYHVNRLKSVSTRFDTYYLVGTITERGRGISLVVRDSYIGIGMSDGTYLVYEMTRKTESHVNMTQHETVQPRTLNGRSSDIRGMLDSRTKWTNSSRASFALGQWTETGRQQNTAKSLPLSSKQLTPSSTTASSKSESNQNNNQANLRSIVVGICCIARLRDEEIETHGFTYAPETFHIGTHFVLTNGAYPDELSVWKMVPWSSETNSSSSMPESASRIAVALNPSAQTDLDLGDSREAFDNMINSMFICKRSSW
eukprot:jgi/Hompol1/6062/HPOL_004824-RA